MATYAEVEDLRDWFIDTFGEAQAKINALNGEENQALLSSLSTCMTSISTCGQELVKFLDAILIDKKTDEYS